MKIIPKKLKFLLFMPARGAKKAGNLEKIHTLSLPHPFLKGQTLAEVQESQHIMDSRFRG
jgi:hypothetical protein